MGFEQVSVEIIRLPHGAEQALPIYQTSGSAGMDLCACIDSDIEMTPGQIVFIPTGFAIAIPQGYEMQIRPRSGMACKHGISVPNSPGTIDADYRGEVKVALINLSQNNFVVTPGMRVAQAVLSAVPQAVWKEVTSLDNTERGAGGFGSTGTK